MNADRSASNRIKRLQAQTLAAYHARNPTHREGGRIANIDSSIYTIRNSGDFSQTIATAQKPFIVTLSCGCESATPNTTCATCCPVEITNLNWSYFTPEPPYDTWTYGWSMTWDPVACGVSYELYADGIPYESFIIDATSGTIYTNNDFTYFVLVVKAPCCSDISGSVAPCFLAGTPVTMVDGSTKPIETVAVGDAVVGAFGEINTVLALHRPLLGTNTMTKINGTHSTSSHHPHISVDRKFYAARPDVTINNTYGRLHTVLDKDGRECQRLLFGLKKSRIQTLEVGVELKKYGGSEVVHTLETYSMAPETQLYNLVVSGSHTYCVDGFAVTGWPREDDFNYDSWTPKAVDPKIYELPASRK